MINKTITFAITVIFALMTTTTLAFAAPLPNGQPFQQIQQQLTALQDQVDDFVVDFSDFIAQIQAEATARQAADTTLQSNIDNEAAARQAADALLQTRVNGNCAVGSSIRQINNDGTVVCEIDDVGTGSNGRLVVISREDQTPGQLPGEGAVTFSFASCLPGEVVVGGGYRVTPALVNVFSESSEFSEGAFGWLVNAYYETGTTPGSVTAIAYCATITP